MRKSVFLPLAAVTLALNSGCAEQKRIGISSAPAAQQNSVFMRGGVKLLSKNHKTELTIVDYSEDEMVASISLTNDTNKAFVFSEKNITARHQRLNRISNAKIYSYEELLAEYSDTDYSAVSQVGQTAASIGASFIPFGNIALTLGSLLYSLSSQGLTNKSRIDSIVSAQLGEAYLRQQTVNAKTEYGGIVKIGFEEGLAKGDKVLFTVTIADQTETFTFVCE